MVDTTYLNYREAALKGIEQTPPYYPKTIGKVAAIQGNLCCFQPVNGGGQLIATDADEGQLFKDFVKMLSYKSKYKNIKCDMLQALYIVSENGDWGHVHDRKYILRKLEHLFWEFYGIAKIANKFIVYDYKTLKPRISCQPCFPRATVHFGVNKIQNNSVITPLVIEWNYQDETGLNDIFSECSDTNCCMPKH